MPMTRIEARRRLIEWLRRQVSLYDEEDRVIAEAVNTFFDEEVFSPVQIESYRLSDEDLELG